MRSFFADLVDQVRVDFNACCMGDGRQMQGSVCGAALEPYQQSKALIKAFSVKIWEGRICSRHSSIILMPAFLASLILAA